MTDLRFRSVYAVERAWSARVDDLHDTRRELGATTTTGLPAGVRAVAGVFLDAWSGYASESAQLAAGFVLALSAADYTFHDTDGYVAEQLLDLDGRLGPER